MKLPDFPWDRLAPFKALASAHPEGLIDLSIGTPIDHSPVSAQEALRVNTDAPGYPLTVGSFQLRTSINSWIRSRYFPHGDYDFLPTIGSKELVGLLPTILNAKRVIIPELAYPTYQVGALVAGAEVISVGDDPNSWPTGVDLAWINSPANPHGRVLTGTELTAMIAWARANKTLLVSDECYLELGWSSTPISLLTASAGNASGILVLHSLSKSYSAAGYRTAFLAGDSAVIKIIREVRKHLGLMMPAPIQSAMAAMLADPEFISGQRQKYRARRQILISAVQQAGLEISYSEAGLYLWATRGEDCWESVQWAAERGVLITPGIFYGESGRKHCRLALTASDLDIKGAAARLTEKI